MPFPTITILIIFLLLNSLYSQIVHVQGAPWGWNTKRYLNEVPVYKLPPLDNNLLISQYSHKNMDKPKPFRFAEPFSTNLSPENSGVWEDLTLEKKIWSIAIESFGAKNLNLLFDNFKLQPGERLFIYSADRQKYIGPFTYLNNKTSNKFSTVPLEGDKIIVEYQVPAQAPTRGQFTISQIAHGFRELGKSDFGDSQPCQNNVICPEWNEWTCNTQAVATIIDGGKSICTGQLLNNTAQDGRPLLHTAAHCVGDEEIESDVSTWVFVFKWISPSCDPSENIEKNHSISGSTLLNYYWKTDYALLELSETPPSAWELYYNGWDATGNIPKQQMGIHHPSGDIMKISFDSEPATINNARLDNNWEVIWNDGVTEGNSSGSALYDESKRVIGQLYGGTSFCSSQDGPDWYGRIFESWNLGASEFLDPLGTGNKILDGKGVGACAGDNPSVIANFSFEISEDCSGQVNFTNTSENATAWNWNFGDGGTSTEQDPTHTYTQSGNYNVVLSASNPNGGSHVSTQEVSITCTSPIQDQTLWEHGIEIAYKAGSPVIQVNLQNITDVSLFDVNGKHLSTYHLPKGRQEILVKDFPNGIYYLKFSKSKRVTKIILIN